MNIPILYEDESLLVINKPPGLVVNRAESVKEPTVQDWAEARLNPTNPTNDDFFKRSGIVHRLDKETSGCLLIAKTPLAFIELQRQFKARVVKKTYLAIVHGKLVPETGEMRAPIGRLPWNRERFGVVPGGKEAITKYKVLSVFSYPPNCPAGRRAGEAGQLSVIGQPLSLVELYPETGRTHQIRVHLKYLNHPIIGDYLYAGRKTSRRDRAWAPRLMLHAWKISFQCPDPGKNGLAIEAPIPDDMSKIINVSNPANFTNPAN